MAELRARTLLEANLYINLALVAGLPADSAEIEPLADYQPWTRLVEGPDNWTLHFDGPDSGPRYRFEIVVPYQSEADARRDGLRFGHGISTLIDAGQWLLVAAGYARRALAEDFEFSETPDDRDAYLNVVAGWELVIEAATEAMKFLPEGYDELPSSAVWTDMGLAARRAEPHRFTRAGLVDDIGFYRENLEDFVGLYGDRHADR